MASDFDVVASTGVTDADIEMIAAGIVAEGEGSTAAIALDEQLRLYTAGDVYLNWGGLNEKWLQSATNNGSWYYIKPDGTFWQWHGGAATNATQIESLDPAYYSDLESLYDAYENSIATGGGTDGAGSTSGSDDEAARLDETLDLLVTGDAYLNWGGLQEKWLQARSDNNDWYYIKPDGTFWEWHGGLATNATQIAALDGSYYDDLASLYNAAENAAQNTADNGNTDGGDTSEGNGDSNNENTGDENENTEGDQNESDPDTVALALAHTLDDELDFFTSGNLYYNWSGMQEKWVQAANDSNKWYYIKPDGTLWLWNKDAADSLRASLTPVFHSDVSLLTDPPAVLPEPPAHGITDASFSDPYSSSGFTVYNVQSIFQRTTNNIRVLLPSTFDSSRVYQVIYVLPVEPGNTTQFGDGLTTIRNLGLHNSRDVIFVAPSFTGTPWYANHVSNAAIWQETYFKDVVVPFIEYAYPTSGQPGDRLLLGFSKSGYGAVSMILRNPEYFGRVAVWDSPLAMSDPASGWEFLDILGSRQNFHDNYQITNLIPENAEHFIGQPTRIFLLGYSYDFTRRDHATIHSLMNSLNFPHFYELGTHRSHVWASGWIPEVVDKLLS